MPSNLLTRFTSPLGFSHPPNFFLFIIFAGALLGFTLARLPFLSFSYFCPQTLDCYNYTPKSPDKTGIILHLATILPASLLVVIQFIPRIRKGELIFFHRINGYIILMLCMVSAVGVGLLAPNVMGGDLVSQMAMGVLGVCFVWSLGLAWWNIRRKQIEEHRAWMLRGWFYAGSIVSMRLIMMILIRIMGSNRTVIMPCAKIAYYFGGSQKATLAQYPECATYFSGEDTHKALGIRADFYGEMMNSMAAWTLSFGPALWLAFIMHAIGVEIYLHLTLAEANRLRNVSYQLQKEAGMKRPGRMGLTADRLGYAERWVTEAPPGR
ncbi:hypothetical protein QBC38DRAFT_424544 [Podospora fimiseda]|uniref:Uncharacterized protein n=1 Tax=Podospora fimiseda TaxID=252190 RepID=A0AAN7GT30_9PEZI|nr:hypothetical protein QBC38DRAFT_424544 [Podospora fimiseda]